MNRFEIGPWREHGALRVTADGHFLEHEDGTGFVWLGDTAWRLVCIGPEDVKRYFRNRVELGFNVVLFTLANMQGKPNYAGERPFTGPQRRASEVVLNDAYWRHVDDVVRLGREAGVYLGVLPWWSDYISNPADPARQAFADPGACARRFGELMGERYGGEPHLFWVLAGEYHKPYFSPPFGRAHFDALCEFLLGVRSIAPGGQLMTAHPLSRFSSSDDFHEAEWLDFNMIQSHTSLESIHTLISSDWQREPAKPTVNGEGWYESEEAIFEHQAMVRPVFREGRNRHEYDWPWLQRLQLYWSIFLGGIGYTYGHRHLWRMNDAPDPFSGEQYGTPGDLSRSALDAPGAQTLAHARWLIEWLGPSSRVPDQSLLTHDARGSDSEIRPTLRCAMRSPSDEWIAVYTTAGKVIGIRSDRLAGKHADAYWFNPRNGMWRAGDDEFDHPTPFEQDLVFAAEARYFLPPGAHAPLEPASWSDLGVGNDWVLLLRMRDRP